MMGNWASWAIKHRSIVYFFSLLVAAMGIFSYFKVGRQEDPVFTVKQMVISAAWPGATAKQMEKFVTEKIEKTAQQVKNFDYVESYSRPNFCVINVYLLESTPASAVRDRWIELRNLIEDSKDELPADLQGPYYDDHFDDVYGNVYAVTSDSYSYEDMRRVAERLKDTFKGVKDVQKVELLGVQPEKIYVEINNDKLAELGMDIDALASVINAETSITASPMLHENGYNTFLRLTGIPDAAAEIANIPISGNGRTLHLGDIADIKRDYADPPESKMYFNGAPAIGIAISMRDGGNNMELGDNLKNEVAKMKNELPLGFEIHQVHNQPEVVEASIDEFMESLIEAIVIVLIVSLMTLGRESGYVISCCIPLVLMASFIGMFMLGIDMHKISLGSLIVALGMLVDDSVVVIEMIELKIGEGWDKIKACSYAFESCAKPLLTGTMITCVSFMPIAFADSDVGEYAGSLFVVITVTLMSSWFVSATLAPTLAFEWLKVPDPLTQQKTPDENKKETVSVLDNPLYHKGFYVVFNSLLDWALSHRKCTVAITIAIFIGTLLLSQSLREEFFPGSTRPELLVDMNLPEGASIKAADEAAKALTDFVIADDDVDRAATYVGTSGPRFVLVIDPSEPHDNFAHLVVVAKDTEARDRMAEKIHSFVEERLPDVQAYSRSIPLGPPTPYPVMIRVSATTDAEAKEYAQKLKDIMLANPHVTLVRFDWMEHSPAIKAELDDDKLRQMGLTRKAIASALYAEISGYTVGHYYERDMAIDIVFRLKPGDHQSIEDIGNMTIPTSQGAVQLRQVANLSYDNEEGMIWRRDLLPTVTVNAGIVSGITGNDVNMEIMKAADDMIKNLPAGVKIEAGGPAESSDDALDSIITPIPAMLIIMIVLLIIMLMNIKKLIVVLLTAPLCIIGVIIGLFLFDTPLDVMAEIGALSLIGTVIRNSTVLVDQIDQHMAMGMAPFRAVKESVIVRFRPIMLTALTTVLGLIPMFPSIFWRGLAIAISCGLTLATMITLIVLPVIYCMIFKIEYEK